MAISKLLLVFLNHACIDGVSHYTMHLTDLIAESEP